MTNTFEANIFKPNTYLHTNLSYLKAYYVMMIILALLTSADNSGDLCVCFLLRRNHSVLKDLLLNLLQFSLMLFPPILEIFLIATHTHSFSSSLFLLKLFFYSSTAFLMYQYIGKHPTNPVKNIIFKLL